MNINNFSIKKNVVFTIYNSSGLIKEKVYTSYTSVEQSLFKQFVTEDNFALVHHSCEEVVVFVHRRVL